MSPLASHFLVGKGKQEDMGRYGKVRTRPSLFNHIHDGEMQKELSGICILEELSNIGVVTWIYEDLIQKTVVHFKCIFFIWLILRTSEFLPHEKISLFLRKEVEG